MRSIRRPRLRHLRSDSIIEEEMNFSEPGRSTEPPGSWDDDELGTCCIWGDPLLARSPFRSRAQTSLQRHTLPPATSRAVLYRNLIQLSCRVPPITLPQLMDYHDLYPETNSTRSYNFLISMAIRTASFGSVQWLLESMAAADISRNLETHKLVIRWQIRVGAWDAAWQTMTGSGVVSCLRSINDGNDSSAGWPDFLWLEFFGSLKRRSIRRKGVVIGVSDDPFVLYAQRFLRIMEKRPSSSLIQVRPRVIHSIAYVLLQLQQQKHALEVVQTYFNHLPTRLTPDFTVHCLDIIHILILFGSRKRGLKKFHEHRRILTSLLASHPSLKPTSTTLFLLLGSLRGAMRSGALASECLASFKRRWGTSIEDRRVRLRVASLALKQGRLDISNEMLSDAAERDPASNESASDFIEHGSSRRPRFKDIFRGTGNLQALQIRLGKRMRREKRRRTDKIQSAIQSS
ncbi:hypothetical protein BT96DRAFT_849828 [Gymnopus androsaceus JB14]|uniref:Pentatricopeptide repeat-containing protein n=1 Tax=Gymnopus androsaceus JB14 TaxID=1447944 RepID=A0A6A4IGH2_9AGAR|nr:hypothetical protein BT96DRAFT_849828 [Gymnopus androsaceus JB14]